MNTYIIKKLGEALAFATVGNETIETNEEIFIQTMGAELVAHIVEMNDIHIKNITHYVNEQKGQNILIESQEKVSKKLSAMRDLSLGAHKNTAEQLFEWLSFLEGAAFGCWTLIKGTVADSSDEALRELAEDGASFHFELLEHIARELGQTGADK
ncbi:MAG: hypothetical protein KBB88_00965 [Candidatus Pacebacteria bacterium]|nr:hypothetical protein [Candidatus Paceibacterota bacterium]